MANLHPKFSKAWWQKETGWDEFPYEARLAVLAKDMRRGWSRFGMSGTTMVFAGPSAISSLLSKSVRGFDDDQWRASQEKATPTPDERHKRYIEWMQHINAECLNIPTGKHIDVIGYYQRYGVLNTELVAGEAYYETVSTGHKTQKPTQCDWDDVEIHIDATILNLEDPILIPIDSLNATQPKEVETWKSFNLETLLKQLKFESSDAFHTSEHRLVYHSGEDKIRLTNPGAFSIVLKRFIKSDKQRGVLHLHVEKRVAQVEQGDHAENEKDAPRQTTATPIHVLKRSHSESATEDTTDTVIANYSRTEPMLISHRFYDWPPKLQNELVDLAAARLTSVHSFAGDPLKEDLPLGHRNTLIARMATDLGLTGVYDYRGVIVGVGTLVAKIQEKYPRKTPKSPDCNINGTLCIHEAYLALAKKFLEDTRVARELVVGSF